MRWKKITSGCLFCSLFTTHVLLLARCSHMRLGISALDAELVFAHHVERFQNKGYTQRAEDVVAPAGLCLMIVLF